MVVYHIDQDWRMSWLPVAQHYLRRPTLSGSQGLRHRDDPLGPCGNTQDSICPQGYDNVWVSARCQASSMFKFYYIFISWKEIDFFQETDKPDDPAEIVEIVDDRGYSHLIRGPFLVPRRYFFGLITIQEPFDPQQDLGWDLSVLKTKKILAERKISCGLLTKY